MNIVSVIVFALVAIALTAIGVYLILHTARFIGMLFGQEGAARVKEWSIKVAGIGMICFGVVFGVASVAAMVDVLGGH